MTMILVAIQQQLQSKGDVRQPTKSADFCGRGLVARENWPIKSMNHDAGLSFSSATSYDIS